MIHVYSNAADRYKYDEIFTLTDHLMSFMQQIEKKKKCALTYFYIYE